MVFWSEDSCTLQLGSFPGNLRGAGEASSLIFANFIYQVLVKVDLKDIPDDNSLIVDGDADHELTRDELRAAKQRTVHLAPVDKIAVRCSDLHPGSTALPNCQVRLQRAIEGRMTLTEHERRGK